ncbi:MAG: hypothetical protein AAGI38_12790 [Bacteroidota bacterium]
MIKVIGPDRLLTGGTVLLMGVLLAGYALINGYPLVTSDTGAYIDSGFSLVPPSDRPIYYGLFLRMTSFGLSLWIPVLFQGFLVSLLMYRCVKVLGKGQSTLIHFVLTCLFTFLFTGVSWYVGQLMADIFTAILALSVFLYFKDEFSGSKPLYMIIALVSTTMHNAHILILTGFCLVMLLFSLLRQFKAYRKAVILLSASIFALIMGLCSISWGMGYGFRLSGSTHVFLMGKWAENGVLKEYLEENCPAVPKELCDYRQKLPQPGWEFVWNNSSPLYTMGGWGETKEPFTLIIKEILSSPRYLVLLFKRGVVDTFVQMSSIEVGDGLRPYRDGTNPFWKVQAFYAHELDEYLASMQQQDTLSWNKENSIYSFAFLVTSLLVIISCFFQRPSAEVLFAYLIFVLLFALNAAITANLANVLARLSSRVFWIIPMLNLLVLSQYLMAAISDSSKRGA